MNPSTTPPGAAEAASADSISDEAPSMSVDKATRRQIRGSSLFLVGRLISMGLGFFVQVLTVRYLTKSDYGAFAYALSIVLLGRTIVTLSLDVAVARFLPNYYDEKDYNKLFGALILVAAIIITLSLAVVGAAFGLQGFLYQSLGSYHYQQTFELAVMPAAYQAFVTEHLGNNQATVMLLLILIILAPIQSIDTIFHGIFAVFSRPRAIFFRRYVIAPALELIVVLLLIMTHSDVYFLAAGYVIAGALGIIVYGVTLYSVMQKQGLFKHFNIRKLDIPVVTMLLFTIPLITTDLVPLVMNSMDAVILERTHDTTAVAAFRAVQPTARLNQIILMSFSLLFATTASRIFARKDKEEMNHHYWQNAVWIMIFSFPVFAMTFSFAHAMTVFLYDVRYEESSIILALLSLGYYFNAATGNNGKALQIFGKLRYVVITDVLAVIVNLVINLLLIPPYGALGAAIGTAGTMIVYNSIKQIGLMKTGIQIIDWRYLRVYVTIILATIGLLLIQLIVFPLINFGSIPTVFPGAVLVGLVSLLLLRWNRKLLNVDQMFPELLRIPGMRWFLSG
jgi:O-antigen/teichoic acid export membrane protein